MELFFTFGNNTNPYLNLALEWSIFEKNENGVCLFLWQNDNTVVIGANQNPYLECNLQAMEKDNVKIVRRRTGGGAVYHDLGNLNFSFIASKESYDVKKQMSVIQKALSNFGVAADISGRNDILCEGKKFSGNAFYTTDKNCLHHGTILIDTNFEKMKAYLLPNKEKLAKKGVTSMESRVVNLSSICPDITIQSITEQLKSAFEKVYNQKCKSLDINENPRVNELAANFANDKYIFGTWADFKSKIKGSFEWGIAEIELDITGGNIINVRIASDSLYPSSIEKTEKLLLGKNTQGIKNMQAFDIVSHDIINLIRSKLCTI